MGTSDEAFQPATLLLAHTYLWGGGGEKTTGRVLYCHCNVTTRGIMDSYEHDPRLEVLDVERDEGNVVGPDRTEDGSVEYEGVDTVMDRVADSGVEGSLDPQYRQETVDDDADEPYDAVDDDNLFTDPVHPRAGEMNDELLNLR